MTECDEVAESIFRANPVAYASTGQARLAAQTAMPDESVTVIDNVAESLYRLARTRCIWTSDAWGDATAGCGQHYHYTTQPPNEDGFDYCPFCGHPIVYDQT
jgi:hypothetical protein